MHHTVADMVVDSTAADTMAEDFHMVATVIMADIITVAAMAMVMVDGGLGQQLALVSALA
jgi:hypothetical protein